MNPSSLPAHFSMWCILLSATCCGLYLSLCGCWLLYPHSPEEDAETDDEMLFIFKMSAYICCCVNNIYVWFKSENHNDSGFQLASYDTK